MNQVPQEGSSKLAKASKAARTIAPYGSWYGLTYAFGPSVVEFATGAQVDAVQRQAIAAAGIAFGVFVQACVRFLRLFLTLWGAKIACRRIWITSDEYYNLRRQVLVKMLGTLLHDGPLAMSSSSEPPQQKLGSEPPRVSGYTRTGDSDARQASKDAHTGGGESG